MRKLACVPFTLFWYLNTEVEFSHTPLSAVCLAAFSLFPNTICLLTVTNSHVLRINNTDPSPDSCAWTGIVSVCHNTPLSCSIAIITRFTRRVVNMQWKDSNTAIFKHAALLWQVNSSDLCFLSGCLNVSAMLLCEWDNVLAVFCHISSRSGQVWQTDLSHWPTVTHFMSQLVKLKSFHSHQVWVQHVVWSCVRCRSA